MSRPLCLLLAVLVAAGCGSGAGKEAQPETGSPPAGARTAVHLGGDVIGVAFGAGSVWAARYHASEVVRIDPRSLRVVARIPVRRGPLGLAFADGAVWSANFDTGTVSRIDPATNRVVDVVRAGAGSEGIAGDADAVWTVNKVAQGGSATHVDPRTGRVLARIPVGQEPRFVTVGLGSAWATSFYEGTLARIDPERNRVVYRKHVATGPQGVAVAGGSVWIGDLIDGTVVRFDPDRRKVTKRIRLTEGGPEQLVADGEVVWVVNSEANRVEKLDTRTATIVASYRVGAHPREAAVGAGAVWVGSEDAGVLTRVPAG